MSAADQHAQPAIQGVNASSGRVDFILARMKTNDVSRRQIGVLAGIRPSRICVVLHSEADKRSPMRMDEFQAMLQVLGISHIEATLASELMEKRPTAKVEAVLNVAAMVSQAVSDLPIGMLTMLDHIDGLDHADVRPEHGDRVAKLVMEFLTGHYTRVAGRREIRIERLSD